MPRCAITPAVTATTSASMPWNPCTQPLAGSSSGGARKICTVPRKKRKNVKPIHFQARGQAPNAVRKTSSSAGWMIAKPMNPCVSRALSPLTQYGQAKAEAEIRVALAHPEALLLRTSLMYGGGTPSKHELAAHDPGFTFYTNEIRSPVHVTDRAQSLLELAELETAGPLHVAGADDVSRAEFAELIRGGPVPSRPAPETRPLDCSLDSSRAQALLRTRLRGVREVLG